MTLASFLAPPRRGGGARDFLKQCHGPLTFWSIISRRRDISSMAASQFWVRQPPPPASPTWHSNTRSARGQQPVLVQEVRGPE